MGKSQFSMGKSTIFNGKIHDFYNTRPCISMYYVRRVDNSLGWSADRIFRWGQGSMYFAHYGGAWPHATTECHIKSSWFLGDSLKEDTGRRSHMLPLFWDVAQMTLFLKHNIVQPAMPFCSGSEQATRCQTEGGFGAGSRMRIHKTQENPMGFIICTGKFHP